MNTSYTLVTVYSLCSKNDWFAQFDALLSESHSSLPGGFDQDGSAIFEHLISGKTEAQFMNEIFEKSPVYFKRGGTNAPEETQKLKKRKAETPSTSEILFSKAKLLEVSSKHKLSKSNNVTMTKYVNRKRVDRKETKLFMTKDDLQKAWDEKFTVQFYQPQRFVDSLAKINFSLEYTFQTLAGASAYLTPANSQGLEPHHDDVEVFILQTEGSKRWRLYLQNCPILPDTYAKNLNASQLGEPTEVVLDKGDMLYLPRGAIHEAVTEDVFSTHVTFSIYQHNNYKFLLNRLFPKLTDALFANSQQLRCGLPIRIQEIFGTMTSGKTDAKTKSTSIRATELEKIQNLVVEISNSISITPLSQLILERAMDETVDEIVADFVENRLPPPFENVGRSSLSGDRKRFLDGRLVHAQVENGESGEEEIALYSSFGNDRRRHMNHPVDEDEDDVDDDDDDDNGEDDEMHTARFPIRFAPLIAALRASSFIHETKIIDAVAGLGITSSEVKATIEMLRVRGFLANS